MRASQPRPRTKADREKRRAREQEARRSLWLRVPEIAITALLQARPGVAAESQSAQQGLAMLCWYATLHRRRHRDDPGALWVRSLELDGRFGRGEFRRVNDRHKIFEIGAVWSTDTTRAYRMRFDLEGTFSEALAASALSSDELIRLIRPDGRIVRTARSIIAALVPEGGARLLEYAPINIDALKQLDGVLEEAQHAPGPRRASLLAALCLAEGKDLKRVRDNLHRVLIESRTTLGGRGRLLHEYRPCETGRLFAQGVNLQSVDRIIKIFALRGFFEFDFSNCHLTIFEQLAARRGVECGVVRRYLQQKKAVRSALAERIGITHDEIKSCLIALAYGARQSVRPADAIPDIIGVEAAKRLYCDPFVSELIRELQKGREANLRALPVMRGRIINALGLPISSKASKAKRMAHILQGIETQSLLAIVRAYPDEILLLEHDGFVARQALDVGELERLVRGVTGIAMRLEGGQIELPAKAEWRNSRVA